MNWINDNPYLTGMIITAAAILFCAGWLIRHFLIFVWAKGNQPAFGVEIHENATYIRKRSGQLIKIADYAYNAEDMKRFNATAMRAQKEVERERNAQNK